MSDRPPQQLWQLSATELAVAYGVGTITPDAVLEATLQRLAEVNPRINAVVTLDSDGARIAARDSTRRWRDGQSLGPLDGVPITVKDNILVRGLVGFKPSRGMVPRGTGFPAILHDFEVAGPIARHVDDIVLAMHVIGGPRWRELSDPPHDRRLKILHIAAFGDEPVDPAISRAVADVATEFANAGHHVEHAARFELARPIGEIWPIISNTGVAWLLSQHDGAADKVGPALA